MYKKAGTGKEFWIVFIALLMALFALNINTASASTRKKKNEPARAAKQIPKHLKEIKIGYLTSWETQSDIEQWFRIADYLTKSIPGYSFVIEPLSYENILKRSKLNELDFAFVNPNVGVKLETDFGASPLLTLESRVGDKTYNIYSGVIFCRAGRQDINSLTDLKGKTFMAVDEIAFGGWIMAWREFHDRGMEPKKYFGSLRFGGSNLAVINAVRDGFVDAGTVRSGEFERLAAAGRIRPGQFKILKSGASPDNCGDYPLLHSTRCYPQWILTDLPPTHDAIAGKVEFALMKMPPPNRNVRFERMEGWTIPASYKSVFDCLKDLKTGTFENLQYISSKAFLIHFWPFIAITFLIILSLLLSILIISRMNRKLNKAVSDLNKEASIRLAAENELLNTSVLLNTIVDNTHVLLANMDTQFNYIRVNRAFAEADERDVSFFPGKNHFDLYPNDEFKVNFNEVVETGEPRFYVAKPFVYAANPERGVSYWDGGVVPVKDQSGAVSAVLLTITNVTARIKAEEEIYSLSKFPLQNPNPILRIARDGTIVFANPAGKIFLDTWKAEEGGLAPAAWRDAAENAISSGESLIFEEYSGDRFFSITVAPITGDYANFYGMDITYLKDAEKIVRENEKKYRELVENLNEGILRVDKDLRITFANTKTAEMLGYTVDEIIGRSVYTFMDEEHAEFTLRNLDRRKAGMKDIMEFKYVKKDGTPLVVIAAVSPMFDENGNFIGSSTAMNDITERKRLEKELRYEREQLLSIFDSIDALVNISDPKTHRIIYANKAMKKAFGDDIVDSLCHSTIEDLERPCTSCTTKRLFGPDREDVIISERYMDKAGAWFRCIDRAILWPDGRMVKCEMFVDITNLIQMEADLLVAKESAEAANRAKSDFLANMSHELRTPLNAIIGFSEFIKKFRSEELSDKNLSYINNIFTSGHHLLDLINDILDLSKIEAGKMTLEPEIINLHETLNYSITLIREKALKHRISLDIDPGDAPKEIVADPRKLKQILYNLLSNAVKFTYDGGRAGITAGMEDGFIRITVWDTGVGLSEEDAKKLFEPFERGETVRNQNIEGTGLGLAIVKRLVVLFGGKVWVESELNKGSKFHITIPYIDPAGFVSPPDDCVE